MRYQLLVLPVLFALWPTLTFSESQNCTQSRSPWWEPNENRKCYCGSQLSNVTVTLPVGLRLEAVCDLTLRGANSTRIIDLTKEKVSLDAYNNEGNYPKGFIYLSGTMKEVLTGTVKVEEGPAGALWFHAVPAHDRPVFWKHHLSELTLGSDEHYKKLRAPKPGKFQGERQSAQATIRILNPIVLLGQTDEAGTDADFDVVQISKFKPCER